jgi:hypothetical protein
VDSFPRLLVMQPEANCKAVSNRQVKKEEYGSMRRLYDRVPATVSAIADAIRWAERIMEEIDRRHPTKHVPQQTSR